MTLVSVFTLPTSLLIIRNYLGESLSWEAAGYWQAMWYVSSTYLMIITTALSIYYLPRLSEISDKLELKSEVLNGIKIIVPFVITLSFTIYLLKDFIIWVLFSEDFAPMAQLFKWQLVGDVIKMSSWLMSYILISKAMTRSYIFTEISFAIFFVLCSIIAINKFGLVGMSYSYTISYIFYFVLVAALTKRHVI